MNNCLILMVGAILPVLPASTAFAGENAVSTSVARGADSVVPLPAPLRLSFGVNDLGAQLRFHVGPEWAGEARFMFGTSSSEVGSIRSQVFGLRGYRFFKERRRCKLYLGLEGDRARTSIRSFNPNSGSSIANDPGFGSTSGYAVGGFAGVEFHAARRVAVDLDMGPYLIDLKEKVTGASASNWDFVMNTAVNFYLF
jgi:hypothetical protein